jgi:hypothetical protein
MDLRFEEKMLHSSGHQAQKTASKNSTISPPHYFEGEMGRVYGKKRKKNVLMLEYLGRYDRY